jgi:hypothetical protein
VSGGTVQRAYLNPWYVYDAAFGDGMWHGTGPVLGRQSSDEPLDNVRRRAYGGNT